MTKSPRCKCLLLILSIFVNCQYYVITPTYQRAEQISELARLGQTLLHIPSLHWIVLEDSYSISTDVAGLVGYYAAILYPTLISMVCEQKKIQYSAINLQNFLIIAPMPEKYRYMTPYKPRGVSNRNAALEFIRRN